MGRLNLAQIASLSLLVVMLSATYAQLGGTRDLGPVNVPLTAAELAEPLESSQLTVDPQRLTTERSLRITLTNDLSSVMSFGVMYRFEKLEESGWVDFPSEPAWILPLIELQPGWIYNWDVNVTGFISGRYRVIKDVEVNGAKRNVSSEFIVQRPYTNSEGAPTYGYWLLVLGSSYGFDGSDPAMLELYNHGGLVLNFPSVYHLYRMEKGHLAEVEADGSSGPSSVVPPGDVFKEVFSLKVLGEGAYRYVRDVYVQGYRRPIQFSYEFNVIP